jgi:tetratricopeptide (TPR) repeat protein
LAVDRSRFAPATVSSRKDTLVSTAFFFNRGVILAAIALGLAPNELAGALLGLGSTLRHTGQLARSAEVLRSGQAQFPDNREFDVFLALTLQAQGNHAEATKLLLLALADTSEDPGITAYQRSIRHEANRL